MKELLCATVEDESKRGMAWTGDKASKDNLKATVVAYLCL